MSSLAEKRLLVKIISYFRSKVQSNELQEDQKESLEVAMQCLESTFNVNLLDLALQSDVDLVSIFTADDNSKIPTESDKDEAEKLKNFGNDLMKDGKFADAVSKYSDAIKLFPSPTFFCNRAAAYSKLEKHQDAIEDCKIALTLDSSYSKAFGRMGLAYSCINKFQDARDAYKKALELEPNNDSFQNNLRVAEDQLRETGNQPNTGFVGLPGFGAGAGTGGPMGMFDMLNNPMIAQMTQQMMTDPNMQNMISSMMGGMGGGGIPPSMNPAAGQIPNNDGSAPPPNAPGGMNINNLLEMGQRFASMMQQQNPDLVDQLRRQFQSEHPPNGDNEDAQNRPPNPPS